MVAVPRLARRAAGFTYVGLVILVAIIGMVGALTLKADALLRRAAAEEELLEIGAAFSAALQSYASVTPRGQPAQPPTLQDLLKDPRFPEPRRHLRKIFVDPLTGKAEWGVVYLGSGDKGVVAVYSLSQAKPLKVANFDSRFRNFEHKEQISDWKFAATGQGIVGDRAASSQRQTVTPQAEPQPQQEPQPKPQEPKAEPKEKPKEKPKAEPQPPALQPETETEIAPPAAPEPSAEKTEEQDAAAAPPPRERDDAPPPDKESQR